MLVELTTTSGQLNYDWLTKGALNLGRSTMTSSGIKSILNLESNARKARLRLVIMKSLD